MNQSTLQLRVENVHGVTVVKIAQTELHGDDAQKLGKQLYELISPNGKILLNLDEVTFMVSMILAVFINFRKRLVKEGGDMSLCGLQPHIGEVFKLTNLTDLFKVRDDQETALRALCS